MPTSCDRPDWHERAAAVADRSLAPIRLPREVLLEIFQHAIECYPEECCGLVVGDRGPTRVVRCTNVQSRRRAKGESELDARYAFWIDEQELSRALRRAESQGEALHVVYHSHIDTAAYLSQTDADAALSPDGEPTWPGVQHLVVAAYEDGVRDSALFEWDEDDGGYRGRPVVGEGS